MEDHRDDIVVVFAGYPEQMKKMIALNPGLESRIRQEIPFLDYSDESLERICQSIVDSMGYVADSDVIQGVVKDVAEERNNPNFANARSIRNRVESAILAHALRIQDELDRTGDKPTRDALSKLTKDDFTQSQGSTLEGGPNHAHNIGSS